MTLLFVALPADAKAASAVDAVAKNAHAPRSQLSSPSVIESLGTRFYHYSQEGIGIYHLSEYLGHASIATTVSKYGGLMRGHQDEAARMLDGYMERSTSAPPSAPGLSGSAL